jgi:hypothetical protein
MDEQDCAGRPDRAAGQFRFAVGAWRILDQGLMSILLIMRTESPHVTGRRKISLLTEPGRMFLPIGLPHAFDDFIRNRDCDRLGQKAIRIAICYGRTIINPRPSNVVPMSKQIQA